MDPAERCSGVPLPLASFSPSRYFTLDHAIPPSNSPFDEFIPLNCHVNGDLRPLKKLSSTMTQSLLLEDLTLFIGSTYHSIMPHCFPVRTHTPGAVLNAPDPSDPEAVSKMEGHRVVCVNSIFADKDGRRFRVLEVLGSGTYGYVFKCQSLDHPGEFSAMKIIKNLRNYKDTGLNEILIHRALAQAAPHPGKAHVMMPITSFEIDDHICIVMPLLSRSLFDGLCESSGLSRLLARVHGVMDELLQALDFVHRLGIIHCDLKTDNVLFANEDAEHICVIDFGSAIIDAKDRGVYIQSRFYRSPEIILGLPWDSRIDVWSAGCVAAELFLDFAIFGCETESDVIHSMVALLGPFPEHVLQASSRWQRFFDVGPGGFETKNDPGTVLLTSHCYRQVFEERGVQNLENMILGHCQPENSEEEAKLQAFMDFVKTLLNVDAETRVTAARARTHPFILGHPLPSNWTGLKEPKKETGLTPAVAPRKPSQSMETLPPDFLSLF
jgi:dual specificity protein kinase YAK1